MLARMQKTRSLTYGWWDCKIVQHTGKKLTLKKKNTKQIHIMQHRSHTDWGGGIYPRGMKIFAHQKTSSKIFMGALFVTASSWK